MLFDKIDSYFKSSLHKPFLVGVGDEEYSSMKSKLSEYGDIHFVHLSDCCGKADKMPSIDKLSETLRMADVDCDSNKIVLLGLGEYLALSGPDMAATTLDQFASFNLGTAHVVFLLRGVSSQLSAMVRDDIRKKDYQVVFGNDCTTDLNFVFSSVELGMYKTSGFKAVLRSLEDGANGCIRANSSLEFPDSVFPIQIVKDSYEAISKKLHDFTIPKNRGTDSQWENLHKDINSYSTLSKIFDHYAFNIDDITTDFYLNIAGSEYRNWLFYVFLQVNISKIKNIYLKYVLGVSNDFDDFKYKLLNEIIEIPHTDSNFKGLYTDRKKLMTQYPDADVAVFVSNNRFNPAESIYKLTDNTNVEREEIIADIAQHGLPAEIDTIYPDLALYLKKYYFSGDTLSDLLTEYFEAYKQQKIANRIDDEFLEKVDSLAMSRYYNRLRTRDELVTAIDHESAFLCWIDALGVEYLSYIVELAKKRGLSVSVNVGRADLPTITGINKKFYDNWPESSKRKVDDLDDTKHSDKGGYKYGPSNLYPIHLAKELKIISEVIDEAATDLALHHYERYVIASDHGASRLAVLRKKEEKYDTDTQGEHSGRCCKVFPGYDLPFATEENGYIVLADYGRFKGSRAANVEVHGGATLEEVVVPVITLSLKDTSITIKMVEESVKADYKTGIEFTLYVNKSVHQQIGVLLKGKMYSGKQIDSNHFKVSIPDIKRASTNMADVFLGEDLVSHIQIKAVGKSASMNEDFDDLF